MSSAADQGSQKRKRGRPRKRSKLSAGRDTSPQSSSQSSEYDGPPRTRRRTVSKTTASKKQADSPPSQDNILKNDAADTRDTLTKSGSTTSLKSRLKSSASTASTPAAAVSGKRVTRKSVNVSFSENVNDTPGTNTRSSTRLQNNSNVSATQAEGDGNSRRSSARLNKGVAPSPSATSAESPESNRRVSTRSQKAAVPASSVAEVTSKVIDSEPASQEVQESFQVKNPTANRPWARKGKEPARSPSPVRTRRQRGSNVAQAIVESDGADEADVAAGAENSDDDIDEGSIHDSDVRSAEFEKQYDPVNDDKKIQSSTGHESKGEGQTTNTSRTETLYDPLRPWRIRGFTTAMRAEQERMYNREERYTLAGGWACTEEYQKLKDEEMLRYLEDHPLDTWVIPAKQAESTFMELMTRTRLRKAGMQILTQIQRDAPNKTQPNDMGSQALSASQPPTTIGPPQAPDPRMYQYHPGGGYVNNGPMNGFYQPPQGRYLPSPGPHQPSPQMHQTGRPLPVHTMGPQPPPHMNRPQGPPPQFRPAAQGVASRSQLPQDMSRAALQHVVGPKGPQQDVPRPAQQPMGPPAQPMRPPTPQQMGQGHHAQQGIKGPISGPHSTGQPIITPSFAGNMSRPKGYHNGQQNVTTVPTTSAGITVTAPALKPGVVGKDSSYSKSSSAVPKPKVIPPFVMMPKSGKVINFPWHRPMDFKKAYSEAAWDIKEYHQMHFRDMAITREKNKPRLAAIDKGQSKCGPHANYSAKFVFLNKTSEANAKALGYNTVDEVIKAAQSGKLHFDTCKYIELCWKSKNDAGELYQAGFPAWDTLITRQQLRHRPILTTCAAECIIDFCPDLLHGDTLLRIVSEAGYDPKMLRDRYCLNGCMADVNMFTDRVVSALGISREPRSTADELWVCNNMDQFNQYCLFLNSKPWHFSALLPRRQNGASEIPAGKQVIEIDD